MTDPRRRFEGQTVVVTGAGQGLGRVLALRFAAEGATVALVARSADKLDAVAAEIAGAGGSALAIPADLRDAAAVDAMAAAVSERFGAVDVLVNNSGIAGPTAVLWEQPVDLWEETLRVNVTGTFLCCRAFLPAMVERGRGNVVVIGSMTGKRPLHGRTPYAASKTALIGLVRTLAWELGPSGIRVNMLSPGAIAGPRIEGVIESQAQSRGISVEQARADFTSASPLGRLVEPDEVAAAALYLASEDAAGVTGEDMNVSAGMVTYG